VSLSLGLGEYYLRDYLKKGFFFIVYDDNFEKGYCFLKSSNFLKFPIKENGFIIVESSNANPDFPHFDCILKYDKVYEKAAKIYNMLMYYLTTSVEELKRIDEALYKGVFQ